MTKDGPKEFDFDADKWRSEKHKGKKLHSLSAEACATELESIKGKINDVIVDTQTEFQKDLQTDYGVVGVIIYGSLARGDVHDLSDADIVLLATQELHDLLSDFAFRLKQVGVSREVAILGRIIGGDKDKFKPVIERDMRQVIGNHWIVVSPYPEVEVATVKALQKS